MFLASQGNRFEIKPHPITTHNRSPVVRHYPIGGQIVIHPVHLTVHRTHATLNGQAHVIHSDIHFFNTVIDLLLKRRFILINIYCSAIIDQTQIFLLNFSLDVLLDNNLLQAVRNALISRRTIGATYIPLCIPRRPSLYAAWLVRPLLLNKLSVDNLSVHIES